MMQIVVADKQTFLDIAVIYTGSADAAYEIARENGLEVSDRLHAGQILHYSGEVISRPIVDYYSSRQLAPATAIDDEPSAERFKIFDKTFDYTFE